MANKRPWRIFRWSLVPFLIMIICLLVPSTVSAGEELFDELVEISQKEEGALVFNRLESHGRELDWKESREEEFQGHLRYVAVEDEEDAVLAELFLVRRVDGELYILSVPSPDEVDEETASFYEDIEEKTGDKLYLHVEAEEAEVEGEKYTFARFLSAPERVLLDQVFEICCTLMLFLIMIGMGLTLTVKDFSLVFIKPRAIMVGASMQWILIPLVAVAIGYIMGYPQSYPYIFMGIILIMVTPGGTTSNLMTFFAKGDLALSVSLTAFSTVMSLFLTPFLLAFYSAYVTDVPIPTDLIMQVIFGLVIVPLALGMLVKRKWPEAAQKAVPYFSILGIIALFLIIATGILTNLEKLADTERYGLWEYVVLFGLIMIGMFLGSVVPKLFRVSNYQTRALSMEIGLRNSILAMTIAVLLQDIVGDFYSSMFAVSALYGIAMYLVGGIAIPVFRRFLPLEEGEVEEDEALEGSVPLPQARSGETG